MRVFLLSLLIIMTVLDAPVLAQPKSRLRLAGSIPMAGIDGRIDHMAATPDGRRLFVAALGSNRVLRIDTQSAKVTGVITGIKEPQGLCYLTPSAKLVVAGGGDGKVRIYNDALKLTGVIGGLEDADNVRYDARDHLVYVGYGRGALAVIEPGEALNTGVIPLDGHPESFQFETRSERGFVNVPTAGEIEVIDRAKHSVEAKWKLRGVSDNFPMALDEAHRRLFLGTRTPPMMLVLDTESGRKLAALPACGDGDDLFFDRYTRKIYLSGGMGCVSIFAQVNADTYRVLTPMVTARGARTSLLVPAAHRLYVAAPRRGDRAAAVLVFTYATDP